MKRLLVWIVILAVVGTVVGGGLFYVFPNRMSDYGGIVINYLRTLTAPKGTLVIEANPGFKYSTATAAPVAQQTDGVDWPSYNRTLTSDRYSPLTTISTENVSNLKVLCTYDTGEITSFETGLIMINGSLIGTTEFDIFALDPATCAEKWRTHEDYPPSILPVNRGAAYLDGMLFRGTQDGRVLAYDFDTGKRVWETTIADPSIGESVPAAPIAWEGMVYVGQAGGDYKGVKGRMYGLDAKTGKIVWEFYLVPYAEGDVVRGPLGKSPLDASTWGDTPGIPISGGATWTSTTLDPATGSIYVPGGNPAPDFAIGQREGDNLYSGSVVVLDAKTGDYRNNFEIAGEDWHDWDVSNPPILITTHAGKKLMAVAPKDGHVYGFDLATDKLLYRVPATQIENVEAPFVVGKSVRFCPGSVGGAEWNSPAYSPKTNLIMVGEVDWCFAVTLADTKELETTPIGHPWMGTAALNPLNAFGVPQESDTSWHGWVYAIDADSGEWAWRAKLNYPVVSGMTPTAGGVVFFGDVGGNFYALNATTGEKLWGEKIGGAIGGGVITYTAGGVQKVAVATGFTSPVWPVVIDTAKVVILGLEAAN
ncbi:alcohol dehydrogenase (cytochrome c) [Pseudomonas pohangensis]|uniref:Alcohol dehydrogenase (Cytochrome c) n=1 Tax=Pseudomonas pohangensis TaxID=364197 RepID=A0A1H2EUH8_9PSED|nr:PQQ-binding-like beta-propeller repeat protein [Pseudomonas pohangensis]SDT98744.1 alcohol dehydrogenase (cytochrome c) [Pseudomonas pohangensis]